jgi:hypothetical protein
MFCPRFSLRLGALARVVFALWSLPLAAAPAFDAPHIYGIHTWGAGANGLLNGKSGWSVELIHTIPVFFDLTHAQAQQIVNEGFTLVLRIDYDPFTGQTLPKTGGEISSYVAGCQTIVASFEDVCHTWILGNEFNASFGGTVTAAQAEAAYRPARDAIHALQPDAVVLVGAVAPWNTTLSGSGPYPSNRQWLNYFYELVHRLGSDADGFAIHAYGGRSGDTDPRDDDELGFGVYKRWMEIVESDAGAATRPVYLTEMNHAADGGSGGVPFNSYDAGYIQRLFEEIGTWNETHAHRIRCACWFSYANGGFPGYNISTNSQMQSDFRDATATTNWIGADTTGLGGRVWTFYR